MRLTRHTDYAMRVLFYLGVEEGRVASVSDMAERYAISRNHLVKVVHHLVKGGYLVSVRGRAGGVRLARKPKEIRLGDVVRHTEPDMKIIDCVGCEIAPACKLPKPLYEAVAAFVAVLDRYTLADILRASTGLEAFLGADWPPPALKGRQR